MAKKKAIPVKEVGVDQPAMAKVRVIWAAKQAEGWTQDRLGAAMGAPVGSTRQTAHQLLKGHDPRISTLTKFAKAVGVPLSDIISE